MSETPPSPLPPVQSPASVPPTPAKTSWWLIIVAVVIVGSLVAGVIWLTRSQTDVVPSEKNVVSQGEDASSTPSVSTQTDVSAVAADTPAASVAAPTSTPTLNLFADSSFRYSFDYPADWTAAYSNERMAQAGQALVNITGPNGLTGNLQQPPIEGGDYMGEVVIEEKNLSTLDGLSLVRYWSRNKDLTGSGDYFYRFRVSDSVTYDKTTSVAGSFILNNNDDVVRDQLDALVVSLRLK